MTLVAMWERNTVTVTLTKGTGVSSVSVTGSGVKTGSGTGSATVYYGGDISIAATMSSSEYDFTNWTGSTTYTNNPQSIANVTSNLSFTANGALNCQPSVSGTMQAFNPCGSIANGTTGTLSDSRDSKSYRVSKIGDQWWMAENLHLPGGTALGADKTDVDASYINSFTTSNNLTKNGSTIVLPASSSSGFDTDNYSYVYNTSNTTCNGAPCYSYYSWDAATLGSGRSISTSGTGPSYSICPKGWRLPTASEFMTLKNNAARPYENSPFYAVHSNRYLNSQYSSTGYGMYWSNTTYDSTKIYVALFTNSSFQFTNFTRKYGVPVRCIKR